MLASITPLGERGRRSRWGITAAAFLIGATTAGALAGAIAGALGALTIGALSERARLALLAAALLAAVALDILRAVPGPRRQVNERWLDEFRGWVYGLGFGAQLGVGITTVVSSAATYVAILGAFLTGEPASGALVLGCFGLVRGLTPLAAARVHRPDQLLAMHVRIDRWRVTVARAAPAALAGLFALAGVGYLA
jgi:sulfite exporter TauE/SafE